MSNYASALEIISDTGAELGLGEVSDAYGSTDANIIQLRGLLKSAGRKLVYERDWTYLLGEYDFTTVPLWAKSTSYVSAGANLSAWGQGESYHLGDQVTNAGNIYRATQTAVSVSSSTGSGPSGQSQSITDGSVTWAYQCSSTANLVANGLYMYRCTVDGLSSSSSTGPNGSVLNGTELDGTVTWKNIGLASQYPLPPGFSNMIDQTGWDRTNRLPLGGPILPQVWQYLKGRQQGVVFSLLFRTDDDTIQLYPDNNPPGGRNIAFTFITRFWVAPFGSTTPAADAPTLNTDVILFDPLLITRRLKRDWLMGKGFDYTAAEDEYQSTLESAMNADGSSPVLSLRGGRGTPLLGIGNIPFTGFGS